MNEIFWNYTHWMIRRVQLFLVMVLWSRSEDFMEQLRYIMTPIPVHPLSIYLSKTFQVSKKNKQTKQNRKKNIGKKKQLRKGIIANHFNWYGPFGEGTVLVKWKKISCVILTIQEKGREKGPYLVVWARGRTLFWPSALRIRACELKYNSKW